MQNERRVHIVDDDGSVRRSLEHLLQSAGFDTVSYESPFSIIRVADKLSSGCILLDVRMPGMDGLELHTRLGELAIRLPVIVMTAQGDVPTAVKAMKNGAFDFIEKPFSDERLLSAIEGALADTPCPDKSREAAEAAQKLASLTMRERQVLDALAAGHANKTIAYDLRISVRTVEVHRARMLERLGTKRLAEAIRWSVLATMA
jgi:two-component system response regulator FixJ